MKQIRAMCFVLAFALVFTGCSLFKKDPQSIDWHDLGRELYLSEPISVYDSPELTNCIRILDYGELIVVTQACYCEGILVGKIAEGWISLEALWYVTEIPETEPESIYPFYGIVTVQKLNVREGPGTQYQTVTSYTKDYVVEILEEQDGWGRTDRGWVSMEYISIAGKEYPDVDNGGGSDTPTEAPAYTTPTQTPSQAPSTDAAQEYDGGDNAGLVGQWHSFIAGESSEGDLTTYGDIIFYEDGTYKQQNSYGNYIYKEGEGWVYNPKNYMVGSQDELGRYRVENGTIYFYVTFREYEDPSDFPETYSKTIQIQGSKIIFNGVTYYAGPIEQACQAFSDDTY